MAESILYQSVRDANGNPVQQLSAPSLTGLSTISGQTQHSHGRLYGQFVRVSDSTTITTAQDQYVFGLPGQSGYMLVLYADETRFNPVATAAWTQPGLAVIQPQNNSGLGGSINMLSYTGDDLHVEVVALLSVDDDLPQDYLSAFSDFDLVSGFATYHERAFDYICQFLKGREKSSLWNPDYVDARSINGGKGGYDLSRIINIQSQSLRDASANYAYYTLCDRNTMDPQSIWAVRAKEARGLVRAHLEDTDLSFDLNNQRVESKNRSLTSWRISRA